MLRILKRPEAARHNLSALSTISDPLFAKLTNPLLNGSGHNEQSFFAKAPAASNKEGIQNVGSLFLLTWMIASQISSGLYPNGRAP